MCDKQNNEFSEQDDEHLISLIAQQPLLYDLNVPDYKSTIKRDKVWETIAKELNKSGKDCRNRWKNIKDTYYRQKRKNKRGQGSLTHPKSKFKFYRRLLSFLETDKNDEFENYDEQFQCSSMSSGVVVSPEPPEVMFSPESVNMLVSPELSNMVDSPQSDQAMSDSESKPIRENQQSRTVLLEESCESPEPTLKAPQIIRKRGTKRFRKKQNDILNYLKKRDESQQKYIRKLACPKTSQDAKDEIDLFTRQANTVLKKLPSYLQTKAMHEVFETLTKYKIIAMDPLSGSMHLPSSSWESRSGNTAAMYRPHTPTSRANDSSSTADGVVSAEFENQELDVKPIHL